MTVIIGIVTGVRILENVSGDTVVTITAADDMTVIIITNGQSLKKDEDGSKPIGSVEHCMAGKMKTNLSFDKNHLIHGVEERD